MRTLVLLDSKEMGYAVAQPDCEVDSNPNRKGETIRMDSWNSVSRQLGSLEPFA